jgi:DNA polymerase zeta
LAVSYRRNAYDAKTRFVARITIVKGVPFYGFHVGYKYYLKIYALNPKIMTRLADLLRQGAIMKTVFQPYEAHLQYILQWMADYNLYGCGYIDCRKAYFRQSVPRFEEMDGTSHLWHDRSIPADLLTGETELPRVSHCSIEVDIMVQDILNRADIKPRPLHHDFIERLNPLPPNEKLVHSMAGLWRDETRRRKAKMSDADPGSSPFPPEVMVSMSADRRSSQRAGWIHEEEYREFVHDMITEERNKSDGLKLSFDNYVKRKPFEFSIKTSFESVEDLYPDNLATVLGYGKEDKYWDATDIGGREDVDVDVNQVLDITANGELDDYESEEQVLFPQDQEEQQEEANLQDDATGTNGLLSENAPGEGPKMRTSTIPAPTRPVEHVTPYREDSVDSAHKVDDSDTRHIDGDTEVKDEASMSDRTDCSSRSKTDDSDKAPNFLPLELGNYRGRKRKRSSPLLGTTKGGIPHILHKHNSESLIDEPHGAIPKPAHNAPVPSSAPATVNGLAKKVPLGLKAHDVTSRPKTSAGIPSFGFPVVKNPNDPTTISRLSQGLSAPRPKLSQIHGESTSTLTVDRKPEIKSEIVQKSLNQIPTEVELQNLSALRQSCRLHCKLDNKKTFILFNRPVPKRSEVLSTIKPSVIYTEPHYSNEEDVPDRAREWAGREFKLEGTTTPYLPDFDPSGTSAACHGEKVLIVYDHEADEPYFSYQRSECDLRSWTFAKQPPSRVEIVKWLTEEEKPKVLANSPLKSLPMKDEVKVRPPVSQIEGPTQRNKHGFKFTQPKKTPSVQHDAQYMSVMSLELHVNTRGTLVPNPEEDEIQCVFWCLQSDEGRPFGDGGHKTGVVVVSDPDSPSDVPNSLTVAPNELEKEETELDLLNRLIEIVTRLDPDILTGYEVHGGSWGYLIERARLKYEYNLCDELSRVKSQSHGRFGKDNDKWGFNNTSTIRITGRHMINIWRAMRSELNLLQYTMENVVFHLLHRRIPHFAWKDLTSWYTSGSVHDISKLLDYYMQRVRLDLEILEQNELITRTSEQARLLGVDFFSVFSGGSQYKVESLMFRIAKPENYMLVSPSRRQVGGQNALECLPLVMEPQSAFYNSPLLVLDFQSLYPSVMIAYNYCYSTFLGRIVNWRGASKMGFTQYKRQHRLLELLKDYINIAPNGMMYCKPEIRKSLLAKMLTEILETRVMVKSGMKSDHDDKALQRLLNNRQLALKLIANVTYGYTSASFSGRMPCSEIADSIVQTGRETLEKAIALIHSVRRWDAEVVYGDTDSIFVYLKGRSKEQAFKIGNEIAEKVTNMNPRPIKLKFEKVYHPAVLLAKKRYVGFKYDKLSQLKPDFDAKGIETVRRDGTPAQQKIEEKALKILFKTADLSRVKAFFQAQCEKVMTGSVSIQDFCFAKEVKLGTYSDKGPPPPGALISTKRMLEDHRAEPQYGQRVPYVVITGAPGARLIDRCVAPEELLESEHSELDADYYISKNLIPPLSRIFDLVGANVRSWYDDMPKVQRVRRVDVDPTLLAEMDGHISKATLESFMKSSLCLVCKE